MEPIKEEIEVYEEVTQIHEAIGKLVISNASQRDEIQKILVSIMLNIAKHKNPINLQTLVNADLSGVNKPAITKWCENFMPCEFDRLPGKKEVTVRYSESKLGRINFEVAKKAKWYEYKDPKIGVGFDFDEELRKLLAKASKENVKRVKLQSEGKDDEAELIHVDFAKVNKIKALLNGVKNDDVPQSNVG